jgi:hypothetical protein
VRAQGSRVEQQLQEAAREYADRALKLGVASDVALGYVARALGA